MADWDVANVQPMGDWDVVSHQPNEPDDHGLAERQKLSPIGKAISPITGYWDTYQKMRNEAGEQALHGLGQLAHPGTGTDPYTGSPGVDVGNIGSGLLNTAAGGFNYLVGSPVNAAYRSIVGQPIEDVTGIPREYTEFAAQLATPGLGFTKLAKGPGEVAETMPKIKTLEGPDLESPTAVSNRELANEFNIPLTRGQATEDLDAIRREDMASRGAYGKDQQDIAADRFEEQFEDIQNAAKNVGQRLSRGENPLGTPADAGASLNTEIGERAAGARSERDTSIQNAEQELAQRREQAEQARSDQGGQAEQAALRQREQAEDRARSITQGITGDRPEIEGSRQAGEVVGQEVREQAAAHRADYRSRYEDVANREGTVHTEAFNGMGNRIREDLSYRDNPIIIDNLTPSATNAINYLDQAARPNVINRATPRTPLPADATVEGVNLQGIDRIRKNLVGYYRKTAPGSEDQRAVRGILEAYDGQIEHAITQGLFSGDPGALDALRAARASYSNYRRMFGPQSNDGGVGLAMRRIVDQNATPEEIANMVMGSGALGNAGLPVRLADRLEQTLGQNSDSWNAVRQAIWQKASQVRKVSGDIDSVKSANSIEGFAGSTLAQRMFSPQELGAMRNHAQGLRDLQRSVDAVPVAQKAAKATHAEAIKTAETSHAEAVSRANSAYQEAFGGQGLTGAQRTVFQRMAEGTATPEETANAMFSVIGNNPGHAVRALQAVERIVGRDSPIMGEVRQGLWQKLTQNAFGKDQPGQQKLVQAINEFLNGNGRMVARHLYSDEERALMGRYAEAVRRTIIPKYSRTNSDTAVAAAAQAQRKVATIASTITSMLHMGPIGHIGGSAVSRMIGNRLGKAGAQADLKSLGESLRDAIPAPPKAGPPPKPPKTFRPVPFANAASERQAP